MLALLVLGLALVAGPRGGQDEEALGYFDLMDLESSAVSLSHAPAKVVIGQPVRWTLTVEHQPDTVPSLAAESLGQDVAWVLVDGPTRTGQSPTMGRLTTTFEWTSFCLEAGELTPAPVHVSFEGHGDVEVPVGPLDVQGELAADEDAPRPMAGFHDVKETRAVVRPWHVAALLLVGGLGAVWWTARRRRSQVGPPPRAPLERFRELVSDGPASEPGALRERAFTLSALLREAADRSAGEARSGLTDEEWLADTGERRAVDAATLERLHELFTRLSEVKYGASVPSRFAMEELLEKSEATLRTLDEVERARSGERSA